MNQKWKIIFSTSLVIAICFTMASAAIESPFTKSSFDKQTGFADAKAAAAANFRTDWTLFDREPAKDPEGIQKPDHPDASVDLTLPEITRPAFNPLPAPTFQVPDWTRGYLPSAQNIPIITIISRDKAIEIALAQFPGGNLGVIGVTYKRINAPAFPLAVNPCWVVEVSGEDPECAAYPKPPGYGIDKSIPIMPCIPYGGEVIIDAITGEVHYVNRYF